MAQTRLTLNALAVGILALAAPGISQDFGERAGAHREGTPESLILSSGAPTVSVDERNVIEISSEPGSKVLLLCGDLLGPQSLESSELGTERGRRVHPHRVVRVEVDLQGRAQVPLGTPGSRTFVQAMQLGVGSTTGVYSVPITLMPMSQFQGSQARPGDLIVTEFMKDPSAVTDSHGEWIEILSTKAWRLDLEGVTFTDLSGASFTLNNAGRGILIAPGERFVVGSDGDLRSNGGIPVDYQWSGFSLKNSADQILVYDSVGRLLDGVTYDDGQRWPDEAGRSIYLSDEISDAMVNNDPGLWCSSSTRIGPGQDMGTPGSSNETCQ